MTDTANFIYKNPVKELEELFHIVYNMREKQKRFDDDYGYYNRSEKKRWEKRLDRWLDQHTKKEET